MYMCTCNGAESIKSIIDTTDTATDYWYQMDEPYLDQRSYHVPHYPMYISIPLPIIYIPIHYTITRPYTFLPYICIICMLIVRSLCLHK